MPLNDEQARALHERGVHATGVTTIMRPASDLYQVWKQFDQLPRFIDNLERVEMIDDTTSRWTVRGPGDKEITWTAQIIHDEPGKVIAWKSDAGADVPNAGSIRFRELENGRGTEVRVHLEHLPPGGALGQVAAKMAGKDAQTHVKGALHRFRQMMEAGELASTAGQPVGADRAKDEAAVEPKTDSDVRDLAETGGAS